MQEMQTVQNHQALRGGAQQGGVYRALISEGSFFRQLYLFNAHNIFPVVLLGQLPSVGSFSFWLEVLLKKNTFFSTVAALHDKRGRSTAMKI